MPPSPRIKATLDEAAYAHACAELDITPPRYRITQATHPRRAFGVYERTSGSITMFLGGISSYDNDRLRAANREAVTTILHELRHAWQNIHNPELYANKHACEVDAEGWARRRYPDYHTLVRLSRTYPNSGFSRLSKMHSGRVV